MKTSLRSRSFSLVLVSSALFLITGGLATATPAVIDFSATAGSGSNWSNDASWVGGTAPANDTTTNIARFDQTSYGNQPNAGTTRSIAGIEIGDGTTGAAAVTIGGTSLTLGASGITMYANAGAAIITPAITLAANQTWTNNESTNFLTINGVISGGYSIEQNGTGTIIMNPASNTFTGGYTLNSGTIRLNGTNTAGFGTGTVTLKGGIVASTSSNRTLTNAVTINGNTQLGITATAGGILFTGAVNVAADSQVTLVNGGGAFNANTVTLNGNLTIDHQSSATASSSNFVDGTSAHGLVKNGTGTLTLSGTNTYSGGTAINAGQIWAGSTSALGTGIVTFGGGTLDLRNFALVTNAISGSGGTITNTASAATTVLTVGQGDGSGAFAGNISQVLSTKIIAVTKTGTGTQKFSGANTYIGQTTVSGGALLVNGTHVDASATGSAVNGYGSAVNGHFQVASGATLGGTGRIQGNTGLANSNLVLVQSGGHLAPGDGIGALTLDSATFSGSGSSVLNMASGAVFDFQLSGNGGTPDQLIFWNYVSGDFLLNSNALNLSLSGTQTAGTYTVDLFTFFSNSGTTVVATSLSGGLTLGSLGTGISSATINYNTNTIGLTYTVAAAVPEPSTFALLGGLSALLLVTVRRRRQT